MDFLQTVLALLVTLSILVTIHEFGHYWVARLCNVHVIRFSVGFGKSIYMKKGRQPVYEEQPVYDKEGNLVPVRTRSNEPLAPTEFTIAAIPLGGYVKFLDEREGYVPDDQIHLAFNRKTVWQRIAIVSAGPIANFLLAIAAYWMLFASGVTGVIPVLGELDPESAAARAGLQQGHEIVAVDGKATKTWSEVNLGLFDRLGETGEIVLTVVEPGSYDAQSNYKVPVTQWLSNSAAPVPARDLGLVVQLPEFPAVIGGLNDDGRATASGVEVGDEFLSVDGVSVMDWPHLVDVIQGSPEQTLNVIVLRSGQTMKIDLTPKGIERDGSILGFIGASPQPVNFPPEMLRETRYPIYSAWMPAAVKTWEVTLFTLASIKKMIVGAISPKNLSGPITIAQVASATAENGLESFVGFIALLSISLGVINLLPIPVLDGGHLVYYFIELIAGRPVPERVQVWGFQMGTFLIMGIMVLAFYNDLTRL
ncbi:MAG: RIP metalloprotease RseP [Gammaproteobacteria bacterium]|nr:RIP metalloprotease RseP [Gammaproteobacteria bacterium]MBT3869451.1 RIP metalloprotease RseP [Gammaproteobacteria bacterium]MBT4380122.1 RIP metalloprotease RseP [Gammaproteobacteria bacterium]MBT4616721.1 RIP metalloprotease RseP [Gammaproteobacteria bacterium]MBT5196789.1 RIP metalloprotease RseP [Gammaproteobacteria bacterium]